MTAYFTPTATIRNPSGDSGDSGDNVAFINFFPNAGGDNSGDSGDKPRYGCRSRSHDTLIGCWWRTVMR